MAAGAPRSELTRCAVLGSPIGHSLSPALHRAAYAALGLTDWRYDAFEITEDTLGEFVGGLTAEWRGLSLTMPLKRAVIPLLDEVGPQASLLQSVNTVVIDRWADGVRLTGSNTDVLGIEMSLRPLTSAAPVERGCVLGGGATASSALAGLARLGATHVAVVARRPEVARESLEPLAGPLGLRLGFHPLERAVEILTAADVAVSTLPAGGADAVADAIDHAPPGPLGALLDVVYDPWPTPLAGAWQRRGGAVTGGAEMLLHQAGAQVQAMTGTPVAPIDAMRTALRD